MFRIILTLLLLCTFYTATAGEKTLYYDNSWQKCRKSQAAWYRLYIEQDTFYKIEDHYIDGPLYKTGYQTTIGNNACIYRRGAFVFYDKEGHKQREGAYDNTGTRNGTWRYYYTGTDILQSTHHYTDDGTEFNDTTNTYDKETGILKEHTVKSVTQSKQDNIHVDSILTKNRKEEPKIFTFVESMPEPIEGFSAYLSNNIHYPVTALKMRIGGRVIVRFTIDEDGAIARPYISKGIGSGCDEEALRVIANMPYWKPGKQNGMPVRVFFTQPLGFTPPPIWGR